jgi:glycerate dehydrogenase
MGTWPAFELKGKTLGIMGFGSIGKAVAKFADAFGMDAFALKREKINYDDNYPRYELYPLAERSDFVSIHMPLTSENRHIINKDFLGRMKDKSFLINMARGPLVDPQALLWALESGKLAGAAIDVMEKEPPDLNDPLLNAPNLIITPHIAWATLEARQRLVHEIAENIKAYQRGEKRNVVN